MLINIRIDCETITEFHQHLKTLAKQVKQHAKKQKYNPDECEFFANDAGYLDDKNCYGTHEVTILPESSRLILPPITCNTKDY